MHLPRVFQVKLQHYYVDKMNFDGFSPIFLNSLADLLKALMLKLPAHLIISSNEFRMLDIHLGQGMHEECFHPRNMNDMSAGNGRAEFLV